MVWFEFLWNLLVLNGRGGLNGGGKVEMIFWMCFEILIFDILSDFSVLLMNLWVSNGVFEWSCMVVTVWFEFVWNLLCIGLN